MSLSPPLRKVAFGGMLILCMVAAVFAVLANGFVCVIPSCGRGYPMKKMMSGKSRGQDEGGREVISKS